MSIFTKWTSPSLRVAVPLLFTGAPWASPTAVSCSRSSARFEVECLPPEIPGSDRGRRFGAWDSRRYAHFVADFRSQRLADLRYRLSDRDRPAADREAAPVAAAAAPVEGAAVPAEGAEGSATPADAQEGRRQRWQEAERPQVVAGLRANPERDRFYPLPQAAGVRGLPVNRLLKKVSFPTAGFAWRCIRCPVDTVRRVTR